MGQAEFLDWCAFFRVEGWPGSRDDLRTADAMALLANINRDAKKRANAYLPDDFIRTWWGVRNTPVPAEGNSLLAKFKALTKESDA
jgi:hypothetical protein